MSFNSSILSASNNIAVQEDFLSSNSSYYDMLLEYNDKMHDLSISNRLNYYHSLVESVTLQEASNNKSFLVKAWEGLTNLLQTLIDFIKNAVKNIFKNTNVNMKLYKAYKNAYPKSVESSWLNKNPDELKTITFYYYPNIQNIRTSLEGEILALYAALKYFLVNGIDKVLPSEESIYKSMVKDLSRVADNRKKDGAINADDVKDASTFDQYVNSRVIYIEYEQLNAEQYLDHYKALESKFVEPSVYNNKISSVEKTITNAKSLLENYKNSIEENTFKTASKIVNTIVNVGTSYTRFITKVSNAQANECKYNANFYRKVFFSGSSSTNESAGYIHGEEFESDSIFANGEEFDSIERLNLLSTMEFYEMKYEIMESHKRIAIQEALIFADNNPIKFNRLVAMREAEETKQKINIEKIIEFLKKQMTELMNKAKDRVSANTKFIKDNMDAINKPITIDEAISNGDILAGMYRIQKGINIDPFNYDTMKDQLKDKETFFKARVLNQLTNTSNYAKRNVKWQDGMSITDYCKAYYGASMPEDKYPKCKYTANELEANKKNIINFLQSTNFYSAKNDLMALENEAKKATAKLPNATENKSQESKPAANNDQQKTEDNGAKKESMYYSDFYGTYLTEIELNMGENQDNAGQDGGNNGVNNVSEQATALRVYMDCYKDVILAKMTASEFVTSELMQVIKAHIRKNTKK